MRIPITNVFRPGESVQIADEEHLKVAMAAYRNGREVLERLRPHCGKRFRIVDCSFPHVAGVLYGLSGVDGEVWQECVLDWTIRDDDVSCVRASEIYDAKAVTDGDDTFVVITDKKGRVFAKFRRVSPTHEIEVITEVASLRSRVAFEVRFGFDGDYGNLQRAYDAL